jgi:hypothetical protein
MVVAAALWRRLDAPGHDACRLVRRPDGWTIEGTAVFRERSAATRVDYRVDCDGAWRTLRGDVRGWHGADPVHLEVERSASGAWTLGGRPQPRVEGLVDLDFGFTPATNLQQLRRVALAVGESADVTVAWLDVGSGELSELRQRYERRSETTYWYESPGAGYRALLELDAAGFVRRYPRLWEVEE